MSKTVTPLYYINAFNCPKCGVLCPQKWYAVLKPAKYNDDKVCIEEVGKERMEAFARIDLGITGGRALPDNLMEWDLDISICSHCKNYSIWENQRLIYPFETDLPPVHEDMPRNAANIYEEASLVYNHSPRASAALLRLAIETMIPELDFGIKKGKLNNMIGELVKKDIPEHIQQGLDAIRVYGNDGIHPGEINFNEDQETVMFLFELINIMVEELITRKKKISSFYNKLPADKLRGIANRDKITSKE